MSTAIDLLVLSDSEVKTLASTMDIDAIDQELITLWQFTSFEIMDLADWWGVPSSDREPIFFDEEAGFAAFEWATELVHKIALLDAGELDAVVDHLQSYGGLVDVDANIVRESVRKMQDACKRALTESRHIVQIG
jgi:hypothetical protein